MSVIPKIEIGLDQELSMPEDSFMLKYFDVSNKILLVRLNYLNETLFCSIYDKFLDSILELKIEIMFYFNCILSQFYFIDTIIIHFSYE